MMPDCDVIHTGMPEDCCHSLEEERPVAFFVGKKNTIFLFEFIFRFEISI